MAKDGEISFGLLIPIAVLFIVMFSIGERWLLVPIGILLIIFVADTYENSRIKKRQEQIDYQRVPEPSMYSSGTNQEQQMPASKPIYDQKKQKEQGVNCGIFIPIFIIGWLYFESRSWVFLIPLFFLFVGLIENISQSVRGKSKVREEIRHENVRTVTDLSDRTGLTEEKIRQHIVTEKRSGSSDVWFNPSSGEITHGPIRYTDDETDESAKTTVGCPYCGFVLKSEDRFCPYCGAPIKITS